MTSEIASETASVLPPLPSERLAMRAMGQLAGKPIRDVIVMSPGRGQAAWLAEELWEDAKVASWFVDSHRAAQAKLAADQGGHGPEIVCETDLPESAYDLAILPVLKTGEAEMNRELLQQAHQRLRIGGQLIASVNAPADHWLQTQMQNLFDKVACHQEKDGWTYVGKKKKELKKVRRFDAEIEFRVGDRLLTTYSRPSVFSHRSMDTAARIMIREVEIPIGAKVLELGCGNGGVAMAAAIRSETGPVYAADCNTRAVQCVARGAEACGIENLTAILNHDGDFRGEVTPCDFALLNPPYYGEFSIAKHFVNTAIANVVSGGEIWIVTKQADHYHQQEWAGAIFESSRVVQGYDLIGYRKLA